MAVTSLRTVSIALTGGGQNDNMIFQAATNVLSPASMEIFTLQPGGVVIAFPTGGSLVQGITILPPVANTNAITVKGTTADVGIAIHKTDPTSIALDTTTTTQTSLVLTVATTTTGLRVIWT